VARAPPHAQPEVGAQVNDDVAEGYVLPAGGGDKGEVRGAQANPDGEGDRAQRRLSQHVRQPDHKEGVVGEDLRPAEPKQLARVRRGHGH
jgi:hypothetical protein